MGGAGEGDPPGRWRALAAVCAVTVLALSSWFTAGVIIADLKDRYGVSDVDGSWLVAAVAVGFAAAATVASITGLSDAVEAHLLIATGSGAAGAFNLLLLLPASSGFGVAVLSRALVGAALAFVYPPAMKVTATWFERARGLAMGAVIGALTLGSAAPSLVRGVSLLHEGGNGDGGVRWETVVYSTSAAGFAGAVLSLLCVRRGPISAPARGGVDFGLLPRMLHNRRAMLATLGYWGHQWELYAQWAWIAKFLTAAAEKSEVSAGGAHGAAAWGALVGFGAIAVGAVGCTLAGLLADQLGRPWVVMLANVVSGSCAIVIGLYLDTPWASAVLAHLWGATVIADSAQFSAMVTEYAERALAKSPWPAVRHLLRARPCARGTSAAAHGPRLTPPARRPPPPRLALAHPAVARRSRARRHRPQLSDGDGLRGHRGGHNRLARDSGGAWLAPRFRHARARRRRRVRRDAVAAADRTAASA